MANALWTGGPRLNLLSRANAITPSDSDATLGATTALYDGITSSPAFKFGSRGADRAIVADLDALAGAGAFDSWSAGVPVGWTKLADTLTQENTIKVAGASALKCTNGGAVTKTFVAKTGEWRNHSGWLRGDGTANGVARVRIQNLQTFKYLQTDGTWATASADILTQQSASGYTSATFTYQVESFLTCAAQDSVTLQVTYICSGSGSAYFDSMIDVPGVNLGAVFSHNIDPGIVPTLYWSDDNSAFTSAGTATVYAPSFYIALASILYHRYWRMSFIGTNSSQTGTIQLSEYVLGQTIALRKGPHYFQTEIVPTSTRVSQIPGHIWVTQLGSYDPRVLSLKFLLADSAAPSAIYQEHRDELLRRVRMGVYDCVFIPLDSDAEVCVFGKIGDRKTFSQIDIAIWDADAVVLEQPMGVSIS